MQVLFDFFAGIGNAVVTAFNFVLAFFQDFMSLLKLLAKLPNIVSTCLIWLPRNIITVIIALISVVILYKILGREG